MMVDKVAGKLLDLFLLYLVLHVARDSLDILLDLVFHPCRFMDLNLVLSKIPTPAWSQFSPRILGAHSALMPVQIVLPERQLALPAVSS